MYRTNTPAVQKFLTDQINRPLPPDTQKLIGDHAIETARLIWEAAYDQAMQDYKVGPYSNNEGAV